MQAQAPRGTEIAENRRLGVLVAAALVGILVVLILTEQVLVQGGMVSVDRQVHVWLVHHRVAWITVVMRGTTWLGSNVLLVPVLLAAALIACRLRRTWRPLLDTAVVYASAVMLYEVMKELVHRPRPPTTDWLAQAGGWAFPSGHTTQATAAWGLICVLACAGRSSRVKVVLASSAALIVVLVAASRIYLGVHWLTDVLAGAGLGTSVLALWAVARSTVFAPAPQGSRSTARRQSR
jgi:undecaprenyl-diphosphatase